MDIANINKHFEELHVILNNGYVAQEIRGVGCGLPTGSAMPVLYGMLYNAGYKTLGYGCFSLVVADEDDPDVVYKIGVKPEDSGAAYAAWARANPGKHVPTIYKIERYSNAYVVAMPRYFDAQNYFDAETNDKLWERFDIGDWAYLNDLDVPDSFVDTLRSIWEFFHGVCRLDLHCENYMLDKDGNLVVTDPVSYRIKDLAPDTFISEDMK